MKNSTVLMSSLRLLFVTLLFCATMDTVSSSVRRRLHRAKADRVPGHYYVHFRRDTTLAEGKELVDIMNQLDKDIFRPNFTAMIQGVVTKTGHGFAAKLSEDALKYVVDHRSVSFVEENSYVHAGQIFNTNSSGTSRVAGNWGLDRIDAQTRQFDGRYTPPCGLTGRGVDVYVVDSGLFYGHTQFSGRAQFSGCDSINRIFNSSANGGWDCDGHGTGVAGVVGSTTFGVAPEANLLSVRVLGCARTGTLNTVLLGLECILNRVNEHKERSAVVNLSISGASKSRAIKRAIDKLIDSGVTVVGISGNTKSDKSGNSCKVSPGSIPGVITVAGSTIEDEVFNQTHLGRCVDILAPAKDLTSTCISWRNCTQSRLHGSSYAAPHVTGAIALLLQKCPKMSPWKVRYNLLSKMAVPNMLRTQGIIPRRFKTTTPNLLLHTGEEMCSIQC